MIRDIFEDGIEYLITLLAIILVALLFVSPFIMALVFSPWWLFLIVIYPFIIAAIKNIYN